MIQKTIQRLEELLKTVPKKLNEIDELNFGLKTSPEKWSRKEILGHLIDSATNNHQRFIRAQFENSPSIWYDQNNWVGKSNYNHIEAKHLIEFWMVYNRHLIHIIKNIEPANLSRTCTMKDGTEVTLEFLIHDYVGHLEHHLEQF